jgi:hypothetical protein
MTKQMGCFARTLEGSTLAPTARRYSPHERLHRKVATSEMKAGELGRLVIKRLAEAR